MNVLWKFHLKNQYKLSCNSSEFESACIQETRSETRLQEWSWADAVGSRQWGLVGGSALLRVGRWKEAEAAGEWY